MIQVSEAFAEAVPPDALADMGVRLQLWGPVNLKGKAAMTAYHVVDK